VEELGKFTVAVMNEEQKIRDVIAAWLQATKDGDLAKVLPLMAEDVVFLLPGQPPMRGRDAFSAATGLALKHFRIEGTPDIKEIRIMGDYAYCLNYLSLTLTPLQGGAPQKRAGNIMSLFRKEPDGRWVLFRDANFVA
jgi:uncharacterized protein (TIGR02246 family)